MQQVYRAPHRPATPVKVVQRRTRQPSFLTWALIGSGLVGILMFATVLALGLGLLVIFGSGRILPGVAVAGVALGGLTPEDAAAQLESSLGQIKLRDGDREWMVDASRIGLKFDASATADRAQRQGRDSGSFLEALLASSQVTPVVSIDTAQATQGLKDLAAMVDMPAANATIRLVNGELTPVPAVEGHLLNVGATVQRVVAADDELADGALDLAMDTQQPTVTDASALLEKTRALLASPLVVKAFDPITNQDISWTITSDEWGQWLTTQNSPSGVSLSLNAQNVSDYLTRQNGSLGADRSVDVQKGVASLQAAIAAGQSTASTRIFHKTTHYTVLPGDALGTLSWKFGFPMFRIVSANPGINMNAISVGQTINIPSKDDLLPLPVTENKRIVVSISKQRMWVYENGQLKWEWVASTGIADSPTLPGVFQVQSHEKNAYAGNWNLNMPYFMGIYDAVPGFTNGIHGFPSRGGYQVLWENALGRPVTYGCILVSTQNAASLYNWAENGVVIEIQR